MKKMFYLFLLMTPLLTQAQLAEETKFFNSLGTGAGNSGGLVAQEFTRIAVNALEEIKRMDTAGKYKAEIAKIEKAIEETSVFSVCFNLCLSGTKPCHDTNSLVSKNYPDRKIILVHQDKLENIQDPQEKMEHVIHEYAGIAEIEQNSYFFSTGIFSALNPKTKILTVKTIGHFACDRLGKAFESIERTSKTKIKLNWCRITDNRGWGKSDTYQFEISYLKNYESCQSDYVKIFNISTYAPTEMLKQSLDAIGLRYIVLATGSVPAHMDDYTDTDLLYFGVPLCD